MCCFSPVSAPLGLLARLFPPKVEVSATRIFARVAEGAGGVAEEWLVYSMEIQVGGEVAMILPLPVVPGGGESALTFVDLSKRPGFFDELAQLFTVPMPASRGLPKGGFAPQSLPRLVVHEVGDFVASYVPTVDDFGRLDPRFQLPREIWSALGAYDDWGFAVFQLAAGKKRKRIHPMALRFPTREPARIFFPTVHVHDGAAHAEAEFDHTLYYQEPRLGAGAGADERSFLAPAADAEGVLIGGERVRRRALRGVLPNRDTWVERDAGPSTATV